jgi:lipopolysaccharide biosynthesis protein
MAQQEVKNIAIFAHYDNHNIIDDYVLIYLQNLKKFCNKIIFVSDVNLSATEQQKILLIASDIIATKHQEYNFGSWKRGFNLLKEKYHQEFLNADKIIFADDSCYCIGEFDSIFNQIKSMPDIDCYGIADGGGYSYHLQSYFLVLNRTVFLEEFFDNFLQNVSQQEHKEDIIKAYEFGLSQLLIQENKKLYTIFGKDFIQNYFKQNQPLIRKKITKIIGLYQRLFDMKKILNSLSKLRDYYCYQNAFYLLIPIRLSISETSNYLKRLYFKKTSKFVILMQFLAKNLDYGNHF